MLQADKPEAVVAPAPPPAGGAGAFAAMLLGNVFLAFGPWLVRLADVGPLAAGFWRLLIALPLLALLARREPAPAARLPRYLLPAMLAAGLLFALDLGTWHAGILRTRMANATLFGNCSAFLFAGYGFWLARQWPGRAQAAALALAAAGTVLLLGRSYELSARTLAGDLLCILAGIFYFAYLIAVERARTVLGPWRVLATATAAAAPPLLVLAVMTGEAVMPGAWGPLVGLALGSQLAGQGLIAWSLSRLSPVVIGLGLLTQPIVAAAIGWLAYDERLSAADFAGGAAIALALVLVRLTR